jgi:phosphohistidine phosphatase
MQLLVIRHAPAMDKAEFARTAKPDDLRPLTDLGREKMRAVARGLRGLIPSIDHLASSPYARAMQTAEIVARTYDGVSIEQVDALVPTHEPDVLLKWLTAHRRNGVVAVVGHEPHLSGSVSWFLTGKPAPVLELKKGAACLLEFEGVPRAGGALLQWLLTPSQLRQLA